MALAQQTADQAIADARREADETLGRARREAEEILGKARRQADQIVSEARSRAEALDRLTSLFGLEHVLVELSPRPGAGTTNASLAGLAAVHGLDVVAVGDFEDATTAVDSIAKGDTGDLSTCEDVVDAAG